MTYPSSIILDIAFIPIYVLLGALLIFDVIRQRKGQKATFVYLTIFTVARLVANCLLVWSFNNKYQNVTALAWGYILQGLGFSFLISASLGLITRGMEDPVSQTPNLKETFVGQPGKARMLKLLNLINVVALVLLIVGYENSVTSFPGVGGNSPTDSSLNGLVKIGDAIFCVLTAMMFGFATYQSLRAQSREQRAIFGTILLCLVLMAVRIAYATYLAATSTVFTAAFIPKLILQYIVEVLAVLIYAILGIILRR